jgi:hypothetical protein
MLELRGFAIEKLSIFHVVPHVVSAPLIGDMRREGSKRATSSRARGHRFEGPEIPSSMYSSATTRITPHMGLGDSWRQAGRVDQVSG